MAMVIKCLNSCHYVLQLRTFRTFHDSVRLGTLAYSIHDFVKVCNFFLCKVFFAVAAYFRGMAPNGCAGCVSWAPECFLSKVDSFRVLTAAQLLLAAAQQSETVTKFV